MIGAPRHSVAGYFLREATVFFGSLIVSFAVQKAMMHLAVPVSAFTAGVQEGAPFAIRDALRNYSNASVPVDILSNLVWLWSARAIYRRMPDDRDYEPGMNAAGAIGFIVPLSIVIAIFSLTLDRIAR